MNARVEDLEAEEFHRGYSAGLAWAREFSTAEELTAYVDSGGDGRAPLTAFERGYLAGCEEVLLDG